MIKRTIVAALFAVGLMNAPANADTVKLGTLTCQIEGGVGLVIGSNRRGECVFNRTDGRSELYLAEFSRLGIDIGVSGNKTIVWSVFSAGVRHNDLAGVYSGASAEVAAIVGVGVNALVGGLDSSIILNPVSVSGLTGISVAGGIASLRLE